MAIDKLVRENIKQLKPYSSARQECKGNGVTFMDANENALGSPLAKNYSRYPDPGQLMLKQKLGSIKNISADKIFIGNGSDEAIDLLIRIFCEPGKDNILLLSPTYGMYEVCAAINNVGVKKVLLFPDFSMDIKNVIATIDNNTKILFICSPNNPSGNCIKRKEILFLLNSFKGIVVIDEAYIDFSEEESFINVLDSFPNLVILQTLSKAWGLAAIRIGMAYAAEEIIAWFSKIKFPYNISLANQELALDALNQKHITDLRIRQIIFEKKRMQESLQQFSFVKRIFVSEANFLLVKVEGPLLLYKYLSNKGIIVRDRSNEPLCEGCLRITIGTTEENNLLLNALNTYSK